MKYRILDESETLKEGDEYEVTPGVWKPIPRVMYGEKLSPSTDEVKNVRHRRPA